MAEPVRPAADPPALDVQLIDIHAWLSGQVAAVCDFFGCCSDYMSRPGRDMVDRCRMLCGVLRAHLATEAELFTAVVTQFPQVRGALTGFRREHDTVLEPVRLLETLTGGDRDPSWSTVTAIYNALLALDRALRRLFAAEEEVLVPLVGSPGFRVGAMELTVAGVTRTAEGWSWSPEVYQRFLPP